MKYELDLELKNLEAFCDALHFVVKKAQENPNDTYIWLDYFYEDGWEHSYGENGNFYTFSGTYKDIRNIFEKEDSKLKFSEEYKKYNNLLEKIWSILPEFYIIDHFANIYPPNSYNKEKPFE